MKCDECRRSIAAGIEATRMIVEYAQADDSTKLFGHQMPDGPVSSATGQLSRAWHSACFHAKRKRAARGGSGRILSVAPTVYEVTGLAPSGEEARALGLTEEQVRQRTAHLSDHLEVLRQISREVGKPVGDPHVSEAFTARARGGPYVHEHLTSLGAYQLRAHLLYAHGCAPAAYNAEAQQHVLPSVIHDMLHARLRAEAVIAARDADPGHTEPHTSDWREQSTVELA